MKVFGTNEKGDRNSFKLVCCKCGKEADLVPVTTYLNNQYKFPDIITIELRCRCGNVYTSRIE